MKYDKNRNLIRDKPKENEADKDAPLKNVDRSKPHGFRLYWSQRVGHFKSIFGMKYSEETATVVFGDL